MNGPIAFVVGFGLGALLAPTVILVAMLVADRLNERSLRCGR